MPNVAHRRRQHEPTRSRPHARRHLQSLLPSDITVSNPFGALALPTDDAGLKTFLAELDGPATQKIISKEAVIAVVTLCCVSILFWTLRWQIWLCRRRKAERWMDKHDDHLDDSDSSDSESSSGSEDEDDPDDAGTKRRDEKAGQVIDKALEVAAKRRFAPTADDDDEPEEQKKGKKARAKRAGQRALRMLQKRRRGGKRPKKETDEAV